MTAYDWAFRHAAVRVDAERAHHVGFAAVRAARLALEQQGRRLRGDLTPVSAMGLTFHGRLGLAAGFDKNAAGVDALGGLGFSFVEVGTVTGRAQPGNERPRLFRLPADGAILNRMGFNNEGAEAVAARLEQRAGGQATRPGRHRTGDLVLGVNIGKTKVVPEDQAAADHELSARLLAPYADYLVVNVSSPNTPGLRDLQAVDKLQPLLAATRAAADDVTSRRVPLLVKIAPDLADDDVLAVADLALAEGLDGIVATNTTIGRDGLVTPAAEVARLGAGGLSGAPLTERADHVTRLLRDRVGPDLTLIGVGGISTPDDAVRRVRAGATLVQTYTGFVYGGPTWPARVQRALDRDLRSAAPAPEATDRRSGDA